MFLPSVSVQLRGFIALKHRLQMKQQLASDSITTVQKDAAWTVVNRRGLCFTLMRPIKSKLLQAEGIFLSFHRKPGSLVIILVVRWGFVILQLARWQHSATSIQAVFGKRHTNRTPAMIKTFLGKGLLTRSPVLRTYSRSKQ